MITLSLKDLMKVYSWGIDEGQLIMEKERENEELFDAATCLTGSRKYCIPTSPIRRRQLHSDKWFNAKKKAKTDFLDFIALKFSGG